MASAVAKIYEFGHFRFDARRLHLEHDHRSIPLPSKSLETLRILLERQGQVVTRENLLEEVWANSFVEDANLTVAVSTLRKSLSCLDANETYIETVPRLGYRFVAEAVKKTEVAELPIVIGRHAVEQFTVERRTAKRFSRVWLAVGLLGILAATAFGIWFGNERLSKKSQAAIVAPASEAFAKGRDLLQKRQVCESIPYFREAVSIDDHFAAGYANMAAAMAMCDFMPEADSTIARALELDPHSADAQAAYGFIKMFRHQDWNGAETALRRAVALDPNSAQAHHWLGVCLSIRGRTREASGEMIRAVEIEPDSALYHADLGQVYYFDRRYDLASYECQKALDLDPKFIFTNKYLSDIYLAIGDEKKAFEYLMEQARIFSSNVENIRRSQEIFDRQGYRGLNEAYINYLLDRLNSANIHDQAMFRLAIADTYAAMGDAPNTLHWLEETMKSPPDLYPFSIAYIGVDPRYAPVREDPRFRSILQKINLGN
jgi:DNA-binding winged helix-turn-helix (wHTH) protein/Flp pilus assembly protein TadD